MKHSILPNRYREFLSATEDCLTRLRKIDFGPKHDVEELFPALRTVDVLTEADQENYGTLLGKPYQLAVAQLSEELKAKKMNKNNSMPLGEESKTSRGFTTVKFKDHYGMKCSLQESSRAVFENPDGTVENTLGFVWLGIDNPEPKVMWKNASKVGVETEATAGWVPYPVPDDVLIPTRMHLNEAQVRGLVARLNHWLETGHITTQCTGWRVATEQEVSEMFGRFMDACRAGHLRPDTSPSDYCNMTESEPLKWRSPGPKKSPVFCVIES